MVWARVEVMSDEVCDIKTYSLDEVVAMELPPAMKNGSR